MAARKSKSGMAGSEGHAFEALLDHLKRSRGFDFTGYKRSTLVRRVSKRMHEVGIDEYVAYQDHLEVHPDEVAFLFNTILINMTAFFRDPAAWEYLASTIVPAILEPKKPGEPIRVWSAGCASGEEAYTLAMVLAEALGDEAFRRRVKIYATDIDEEALAAARRAVYSASEVEAVPEALRERHFDRQGTRYAFGSELRRPVIFGRHDLVQDPPISRIDLLVCRNVLMYLNAETQSRVLARLHFALAPGGFLFLGKAEMLLSHADLFTPVDLKRRVFSKTPGLGMRQRLAVLAEAGNASAQIQLEVQERVLEAAVESNPSAQIVVDAAGTLVLANHAAQQLFALGPADVGRPLQDLEISYRPLELRSLIEQAYQDGRTIRVADVEKAVRNGDTQYLDVEVTPLRDAQGAAIGVSIAFVDRTERTRVRRELERTREELEHSNEELQSANEELETTNEELQSTNEELETTNEELQSGNEELETMNEELQSTNEELRSLNEQLQVRTQELHEHQSYLEAVLEGLRAAVVVVDPAFRIRSWVEKMQELWGLRREEVLDRSLFELDIGLPVEELRPALEASVRGDGQVPLLEVDAVNRRGASIRCTVTCTPLRQDGVVTGAIVLVQRAVDSLHLSVGEVEGACRSFVEVVQDRSSERSLQRQLRAAASASAAAEERERRRLASDLHDDVGQLLTLAGMKLGALRAAVGGPALEAQLQDVGELVRQAHERTESLTFQLSPPILHDVGLAAAAHWLAEQMQRSYALRVRVESDDEPALDEESRTTLFRALRELLINVARHARVDEACVRIAQADGCVRVVVEDRGAGFDPELEPSGFGLLNVRERLSHMGGRLEIAVVAGDGTRVTLTAPLAAASKEIPG